METKNKVKRGVVVSDKMDKTVVVTINRTVAHKIYKKKYAVSNRFKAHDEGNEFHVGDVVEITETRPISADKKFRVVRKVK